MTQENKELLLKDLCARLPYRVIVETQLVNAPRAKYPVLKVLQSHMLCDFMQTIENVIYKPYLFPLSSMTEEQKREYDSIIYHNVELHCDRYYDVIDVDCYEELNDFYHKNHLDYRGLIPMELANDATGLNIY